LEKYIEYGQNRTIALQTPFPVYLVYFTAWTDAGGDIHFSEDIYDYDRRLLLSLLNGSPSRGWCRFIAVQGQPARIGDGPVF
jgi:murein L,D-transpeptidase YcbB/YkuD